MHFRVLVTALSDTVYSFLQGDWEPRIISLDLLPPNRVSHSQCFHRDHYRADSKVNVVRNVPHGRSVRVCMRGEERKRGYFS